MDVGLGRLHVSPTGSTPRGVLILVLVDVGLGLVLTYKEGNGYPVES